MPCDLRGIAIEQHRAGRLAAAEQSYRTLLDADPHDRDALHWLGVLHWQAGRRAEAIDALRRAADGSADVATLHNLGLVCLLSRRFADAVDAFERATAVAPKNAESWAGLGRALLARKQLGDTASAVAAFDRARACGDASSAVRLACVVGLLELGRADAAAAAAREAADAHPADADAHYYLALTMQRTCDFAAARESLARAIELNARHARAWFGLAALDAEAGRLDAAEAALRRALKIKPTYAAARQSLVALLRKLRRDHEADVVLNEPLPAPETTVPEFDVAGVHFMLAAKTNVFPPPKVPARAVQELFDGYAAGFDQHLQGKLEYRIPEQLAATLDQLSIGDGLDICDLGCGTGLCGPLLKPRARTITGIDLSAPMLEQAAGRNVYDVLLQDDVVAALAAMPRRFDLIVATDVLIYLGDLAPIFEAATAALRTAGRFAFSVETDATGSERYRLQRNGRYAHGDAYLRHLAKLFGFVEERFEAITCRMEAGVPQPGRLMVLRSNFFA